VPVVWSQSSAPCGIGVYIRRKSLRGLAVNLDGEVIEGTHRRVELTAGDEHEGPVPVPTVVEAVASLVDGILADHPELRASVTGLGVAAGGHVDARTGVVRFSTTLGWSDVALADLLRAATGIHTVVVHNDCSALALAEQAFGGGRYLPTFAVVTCRFGIGCALVHDNGLVVGANGSASELGHIVRDPAGPPCVCGRNGCLQTFAAPEAIALAVRGERPEVETARDVVELAAQGDDLAAAALARAGEALGWGISMLANVANPGLVLLHGDPVVLGSEHYLPAVERSLRSLVFPTIQCEVRVRHSYHRMTARGVASEVVSG
jgi:predicted NBD/HSP70 family sugar kinase